MTRALNLGHRTHVGVHVPACFSRKVIIRKETPGYELVPRRFTAFATSLGGAVATMWVRLLASFQFDSWWRLEKTTVNTTVDQKPEGLRARKRRATENAIETSAVKLALELGVENVTVEAICEMADISRSTFFNYFPARDYAIVGRAISIPEGPEAFSILSTAPENLPLGLYRLLFAAIGHRNVNAEVARLRMQLLSEQPAAARMAQISMLESSGPLLMTTLAWLQAHPEHRKLETIEREAWLASSLVHSVVSAQMAEWAQGTGDIETDESAFHEVLSDFKTVLEAGSSPS